MTPNCEWCNRGSHDKCTEDWCECRQNNHYAEVTAVDQETSTPVPNYAILDLWMALGNEPNHEFDDAIAVRGKADVWSYLLSSVRALNNRGTEVVGPVDADPLLLRAKAALDNLTEVRSLTVDVTPEVDVRDGYGKSVRRTLECSITITGPVP